MLRKLTITLTVALILLAQGQAGSILNPKILNGVAYAHRYCTGGDGSSGNPWTSPSGTAGIEEAAAALGSAGGIVHVSKYTFQASTVITIPSNVWLQGEGPASVIIRAPNTIAFANAYPINMMLISGPSHGHFYNWSGGSGPAQKIKITDCVFDGNYANQTSPDHQFMYAYGLYLGGFNYTATEYGGIKGLVVQNVEIRNTLNTALSVANGQDVQLIGNWIHDVGLTKVVDAENGIDVGVKNDILNKAYDNGYGRRTLVRGNIITRCGDQSGGTRTAEGISIDAVSEIEISDNDISFVDGGIEGNPDTASCVGGTNPGANCTWDNTFPDHIQSGCTGGGVCTGIQDYDVKITGNVIHDNNVSTFGNQAYGIAISGANGQRTKGLTISHNTIYNVGLFGISFAGVDGGSIVANTIKTYALYRVAGEDVGILSDGDAGNQAYCVGGIWPAAVPQTACTAGSGAAGCSTGAWCTQGGNYNVTIAGNTISRDPTKGIAGTYGITLQRTHYGTISDNTIEGDTGLECRDVGNTATGVNCTVGGSGVCSGGAGGPYTCVPAQQQGGAGISIGSNTTDMTVVDNRIDGGQSGVLVADSVGNGQVTRNTVARNYIANVNGDTTRVFVNGSGPTANILEDNRSPGSIRLGSKYATGGSGTSTDPWTGWEGIFDNSPREVYLDAGYYKWQTRKTVNALSGSDRASRFYLHGAPGGGTNIDVRVNAALTISGFNDGAQHEAYGVTVRDLTFFLGSDAAPASGSNPYSHGIIFVQAVLQSVFENLTLYGGPKFPGASNDWMTYAGYLLELSDSYTSNIKSVHVAGRYTYMAEIDDSTFRPDEEDTITFDNCIEQGPLQAITRWHANGDHNFLFLNNKYLTAISLPYEVNQFDETQFGSAGGQVTLAAGNGCSGCGTTSIPVLDSRGFSIGDPILIALADDADTDSTGGRVELNIVNSIVDGTHIQTKYPTRFAHIGNSALNDGAANHHADLIRHGGVGFVMAGTSRLMTFISPHFEQCTAGILSPQIEHLQVTNALSSCLSFLEMVPYESSGTSTAGALWKATFNDVEYTWDPPAFVPAPKNYAVTADTSLDTLSVAPANITGGGSLDGIQTGFPVLYRSGGAAAAPLVDNTVYYAIKISAGDGTAYTAPGWGAVSTSNAIFKLATTRANALTGTNIDITTAGGGSQTLGYTAVGASPEAASEAYLVRMRRFESSVASRSISFYNSYINSTVTTDENGVELENEPLITGWSGSDEWTRKSQREVNGLWTEFRTYPSIYSGTILSYCKNAASGSSNCPAFYQLDLNGLETVNTVKAAVVASACASQTPAATVTLNTCSMETLSAGATQINTINTCDSNNAGRELTIFCGSATNAFGDLVGNINLSAALTCAAGKNLVLRCDGTNWQEVSRSAN